MAIPEYARVSARRHMARLTYDDLNNPAPDNVGDLVKAYGNAARSAACAFYKENPAAAVGRSYGDPLTAAMDALYRRVCPVPERPSLPAPVPAPSGGQCAGVRYVVQADLYINGEVFSQSTTRGLGPVGGVGTTPGSDGTSTSFYIIFADANRGVLNAGNISNPRVVITSITREDGGADLCGDAAPFVPETLGLAGPNLVRPPVSLPPAPGLPPVPVTPRIIPVFPIAPGVYFQPEININLGPFNFNFDLGGVTISAPITVNLPPQSSPPRLPPSPPTQTRPPSSECPDCCDDVRAIKGRLEKVPVEGDYVESPFSTTDVSNGFSVELPPRVSRVEIQILSSPANKKLQSGLGGTDVLWAGWVWSGFGGGRVGRRDPIDAALKVYRFDPDWVFGGLNRSQFRGTLYQGFTARVTVYRYFKP